MQSDPVFITHSKSVKFENNNQQSIRRNHIWNTISNGSEVPTTIIPRTKPGLEIIENAMRIHMHLYELNQVQNSYFKMQLLCITSLSFLLLVMLGYMMLLFFASKALSKWFIRICELSIFHFRYHILVTPGEQVATLIYLSFWSYVTVSNPLFTVNVANLVMSESRETSVLVHRLLIEIKDEEIRQRVNDI